MAVRPTGQTLYYKINLQFVNYTEDPCKTTTPVIRARILKDDFFLYTTYPLSAYHLSILYPVHLLSFHATVLSMLLHILATQKCYYLFVPTDENLSIHFSSMWLLKIGSALSQRLQSNTSLGSVVRSRHFFLQSTQCQQ
jgi:hypothetical protein